MSREKNQKNLSESLADIIQGTENNHIPFADDEYGEFQDHGNTDEINPKSLKSSGRKKSHDLKLIIPDKKEVTIVDIASPEANEHRDEPGPLKDIPLGIPGGGRTLRRNSISLPAGLDNIDLLAIKSENDNNQSTTEIADNDCESMACSLAEHENIHPDLFEEEKKPIYMKVPTLRSKRRLSVAPLPALRLNDKEMLANEFDSQSVISNQNSITSVSSLASLLKEKMQMFPSMMKKKKPTSDDFKIKAFVIFLFLVIVFLVGYAYISYHQQILARSYFDRVKFIKAQRTLRVFDDKGQELIIGMLGKHINSVQPYQCLEENSKSDGSVCYEWNEMARLYMHFIDRSSSVRCYTIKWVSLSEDFQPTDCFDMSEEMGYWYGGGLTKTSDWPLQKASFDFAPFITGDVNVQQWGNVLKRYFINSRGVAITIDDKVPLYISMNHNDSNEFCLKAQNDNFAFVNRLTPLPELSYSICTGENMTALHQEMTQQSLWDGIKEKDVSIVHSLLDEPVWQIPASSKTDLTEQAIFNYTEKVIALGFLKIGHVLVNEFWQNNLGDFSLDLERFETLESTVNMLHRRGFRISLTVQPFISTESENFGVAVAKKLLIYERLSERSIPALTRYKSLTSAGVLDVTNNASIPWLLKQLEQVADNYQIDSFFVDFGTAYNMPHYYQCSVSLVNPDQYKSIFMSQIEENLKMIGVSGGISVPRPPAFLSLPPVNSSWEGLQSIITTVLTYGVIGYPFLLPGPVGGDYILPKNKTKMATFYQLEVPPLPDQELYIRWFQLATFLPVLRFTHIPSEYDTELVNEVSKELAMIRQKTVLPLLKNYLSEAMNEALPLIRPLWMLDPTDVACLTISDEFSVGEDIIVAPILQKGETQREVYLPQGVWKDGIDGSMRKGSRWIHNYRVPENKVSYFMKMPDNTRF